jgi:ATP-dependent Zn protease
MGQARLKKLKLEREIAAQNPNASPEQLAKLVAEHKTPRTTQPATSGVMSEVGFISPDQMRINAIHEAGHAVMMTRIGNGCDVTSIDPQEVKRLTGHAMPGYTHPVAKPLRVDVYLCTALAGVMSEAMYATNGMINPKEDDFTHVEEILDRARMQGRERKESRERAEARTHQLLTEYEADIKTVAKALLERKTLSGDDVRTLINNVPAREATT